MSSEAQQKRGYPLPADEFIEETVSFCVTIPAGFEYEMAFKSQLDALGLWWFWKRSEDRPNAASDAAMTWRNLLNVEEDCGMSIDYDAWYEANRAAIYDAMNDIAKQIVSGRVTNISVDEEGGVSDPTDATGGEPPVEDDPETPAIDEGLASIMGAAISISRAIEKFLDKVDAQYGGTNGTPTTILADAQKVIKLYFPSDETAMDAAISDYYTYRTSNSTIGFNTSANFERYMYCRGYDAQAFSNWLIDQALYGNAKLFIVTGLVNALAPEFWSHYYSVGAAVPSQDYQAASCTKVKQETFQLDMSTANNVQFTTAETWKGGHRFLIEVSGSYSDSVGAGETGIVGDAMYFHTLATGAKSFSSMGFNSAGGVVSPTQAQVPFESSHDYAFIVEKTQGSADGTCIVSRDNGAMNLPGVTGILNVTVTDLGDFSI